MVLTKTVLINWNKRNKKYYINKGYVFTQYNDEFEVKVEDVSKGNSDIYVDVLCDYCFINTTNKKYQDYIKQNEKAIIHKDCCKKCQSLKVKESNLLKYGVESTNSLNEVSNKRKNTCLDKYGVENTFQSEEIKDKIKNTCLDKYGAENYAQTEEWKEKVIKTNLRKYGVEWVSQNDEVRQKQIDTNIERYGEICSLNNIDVQNKSKKTMMDNYDVLYPIQNKDIKNKIINTNIEKYGFDNPSKNEEIKEKVKNTCVDRYGFSCSLLNDEVKDKRNKTWIKYVGGHPFRDVKIIEKSRKTMYLNNTSPTSKQQEYLCNLLNGELNYPISTCSLDIAFPKEFICIEYDGGGHTNSIKLNQISIDEFYNKEKRREIFIRLKGWMLIRIISINDYIPSDKIIIEMITYAKEYINSGHSWIKFDIDNSKIINSQGQFDYDFGELRRISKKDLEDNNKITSLSSTGGNK